MSLQVQLRQKFLEFGAVLNEQDLDAATALISRIALANLGVKSATLTETELLSIVSRYKDRLAPLLREGFPFSKIDEELAREALSIATSDTDTSWIQSSNVVNAMLRTRIMPEALTPSSTAWTSVEEYINGLAPEVFPCSKDWSTVEGFVNRLNSNILGGALATNYKKCSRGDLLSGYAFHCLLKMLFNPMYILPERSSCDSDSLDQGVRSCLADLSICPNPTLAIELILFRGLRVELPLLLLSLDQTTFLNFAIQGLTTIPFESWPNKEKVITELLEIIPVLAKAQLPAALIASTCDDKTREVGDCIQRILSAKNLRETYPPLRRLHELLPHMNSSHDEEIFCCSFPPLEPVRRSYNSATRELSFTDETKIIVHDNRIIGVYDARKGGSKLMSILAFDKSSGQLVWGIPVPPKVGYLDVQGQVSYLGVCAAGLLIVYANDPNIHIVNPKDGEQIAVVPMPAPMNADDGLIHITPSGFCYFQVHTNEGWLLYGGQISNGTWEAVFQIPSPKGWFTPMGNWVGFKKDFETTHAMINQEGVERPLICADFLLKNDKLFTVEIVCEESTMKIYEVGKEIVNIPLKGLREVRLVDICEDGTVVCKSGNRENFHFVDIANKQVVNIPPSRYSVCERFIDVKKRAIWVWETTGGDLWKHTTEGSFPLGKLDRGRGVFFVHVDEQDRVYFVDRPY